MNKRLCSLLLCVLLLLFSAVTAAASEVETEEEEQPVKREVTIDTVEEFLAFVEDCRLDTYSENLYVELKADLDFTGVEFESVPIFSGTFDGNDHTMSNISLTRDGTVQGVFRYLTNDAFVMDLHVSGEYTPGGSRSTIGGITGKNSGRLHNCSFSGTVNGIEQVGGIAGINTVSGVIEECEAAGTISGDHFVGGIVGYNQGVIRKCQNAAQINTTAKENSVALSEITLESLTNSEAANTVTDVGGIAGISVGVIRNCKNEANIGYQQMGYNIGGIVGTQSGYITNCKNYGEVQGRKEVGGIIGQMEPVTVIEYSADTLQILDEQLDSMSGLVNRASGNAQANANEITGQIAELQKQTEAAQDAMNTLFPEPAEGEEIEMPDEDTILAAQSTLTDAMNSMPDTLDSIMSSTQSTVTSLSNDLQAVAGQVDAMGETMNEASENIGGTVTDVSDQDTEQTLTGKVEDSSNYGPVLGDLNVGGIVGSIGFENDMDVLEDWQSIGDSSMNFNSEVRAVILNCENTADVTAKKQYVGGIVGWQSLGLVKNSTNTGSLIADAADYVGGISGYSIGYIRNCYAKCAVSGNTYIGGIAGSAAIATDCRSMVRFESGVEKIGEVLGFTEDPLTEQEEPIARNYYLSVSGELGAIDGISYAGMAEPLSRKDFLKLEDLPELFGTVTVRFVFADGSEEVLSVAPGKSIADSDIPAVPELDGHMGEWDGLHEADLSNIEFNMSFEAVYVSQSSTIESERTRKGAVPVLLVQGAFTSDAAVQVEKSENAPILTEDETLLESWVIEVTGADSITAGRLSLPDDTDAELVKLYLCSADGEWAETAFRVNGKYLVFEMNDSVSAAALSVLPDMTWIWYIVAGGSTLLLIIVLVIVLCVRHRRSKKK